MSVEGKTIIRAAHNKENPYAQISKSVLRDSRLSAKAMGIMCYLLSLFDDWKINVEELASHFSDGRDAIRSGLKELIVLGYIERRQLKDDKNRFGGIELIVHECPQAEKPSTEKTRTGFPAAGNPTLLNTDLLKTDLNKNNNSRPGKLTMKTVVVLSEEEWKLRDELQKIKFTELDSIDLIKRHGAKKVKEKLEMMRGLREYPSNPIGWLKSSCDRDFPPAPTTDINQKQIEASRAASEATKKIIDDISSYVTNKSSVEVKEKAMKQLGRR